MEQKQTAVDFLESQIDNELKIIDNLYGKEIMGRKIAFAFVKRILIKVKQMEKEQIVESHHDGYNDGYLKNNASSTKYYYENYK